MDSIAICWLLYGIIFVQYVFSIDADKIKLNQLEKMKEGHDILSKKISKIQFENNFFKTSIKELREENEQLKEIIYDLEDENRTQKIFNSQLKMKNQGACGLDRTLPAPSPCSIFFFNFFLKTFPRTFIGPLVRYH